MVCRCGVVEAARRDVARRPVGEVLVDLVADVEQTVLAAQAIDCAQRRSRNTAPVGLFGVTVTMARVRGGDGARGWRRRQLIAFVGRHADRACSPPSESPSRG